MPDTVISTDHPAVTALVALVASAEVAGELLVSSSRFVDALLDARSEVAPDAVAVVDDALSASAHRSVVPTSEAVELVARITASAAQPTPAV